MKNVWLKKRKDESCRTIKITMSADKWCHVFYKVLNGDEIKELYINGRSYERATTAKLMEGQRLVNELPHQELLKKVQEINSSK